MAIRNPTEQNLVEKILATPMSRRTFLCLLGWGFLTACGVPLPQPSPTRPSESTPTPTQTQTETSQPSPTPKPTETSTSTPTSTPIPSKPTETLTSSVEQNQKTFFNDFLKGKIPEQGDFFVDSRLNLLPIGYNETGTAYGIESAYVQAVMLDAFKKENYVVLLVGTEDLNNHQRVILPVIIGIDGVEKLDKAPLYEYQGAIPYFHDVGTVSPTMMKAEDIATTLRERCLGVPIRLPLELDYKPGAAFYSAPEEIRKLMENLYIPHFKANREFITDPTGLAKKIGIVDPANLNPGTNPNIPFALGIIKIWTNSCSP